MIKSNYIRSTKLTPRINQTVIPGQPIVIEGVTYEKLSRKPYGKAIVRRLKSIELNESIIIRFPNCFYKSRQPIFL